MTGSSRLADCPNIVDVIDIGPPSYFISAYWSDSFQHVVQSVSAHLPFDSEDTFVFWDLIGVNQHNWHQQQAKDLGYLKDVIQGCSMGLIAVIDSACVAPSRIWCVRLYLVHKICSLRNEWGLIIMYKRTYN